MPPATYPVHTTIVPAERTLPSSHLSSFAFDSAHIGIGDDSAFAGGLTIRTCTHRTFRPPAHRAARWHHCSSCVRRRGAPRRSRTVLRVPSLPPRRGAQRQARVQRRIAAGRPAGPGGVPRAR
jgi:hypothetical protein